MKRSEWFEEIAQDCQFSKPVEGGAYCYESGFRDYCDFHRCPKIELEKKEER